MYKLLAQQTSTVSLACMISDNHELIDSQVPLYRCVPPFCATAGLRIFQDNTSTGALTILLTLSHPK